MTHKRRFASERVRAALAERVTTAACLRGDFLLRSGQRSDVYFDKYGFESDPTLLRDLADAMTPLLPTDTQVLAGLELGGVPLATALSLRTGLPSAFVRKAAKTYGTCRLAEGADLAGRNVCVVEDVITTGGQVLESVADLRRDGAQVIGVVCVLWRAAPGQDASPMRGCRGPPYSGSTTSRRSPRRHERRAVARCGRSVPAPRTRAR